MKSEISEMVAASNEVLMYRGKRVAVLAPGSVRGEVGGAERFYSGLVNALTAMGCRAELRCIPTDESSFESILAAYQTCSTLDLSQYDMVISTKAPTFAVFHPNHLLYLVHTVRVFYDMFETAFPWADERLLMQRSQIQEMDSRSIARIRHRFAIGHEVSERLQHWNGLDAEVLHPPLVTEGFRHGGDGGYFFLPGRLHGWKRVDLVIRALMKSRLPMRLVIAGTGEAEADLMALTHGDPRIEFAGRVTDEQLIALYANALAVPFVPVREDYGYITVEAFASGKPVITCTDSGEPCQFVVDGVSGIICAPTPESLCAAMEKLFFDRRLARSMGLEGARRVEHMTWSNVAERLLQTGFPSVDSMPGEQAARTPGGKVAIIDMQPIIPAVGGGRLRLLGLYHALGHGIEARYVGTFDWPGEPFRRHWVSDTLEEIDVPLSAAHHAAAGRAAARAGGKTVIDVAFAQQAYLSPDYVSQVRKTIDWADAVVFSHPWAYPLVRDALRADQIVVYDAQNVEGVLRAQLLDVSNPFEKDLVQGVVEAEYAVGRGADLILACSEQDKALFHRVYGWSLDRILTVRNGVMVGAIRPMAGAERVGPRQRLGIGERRAAIFIGSAYGPNVAAAEFIINTLAPELPEMMFVIAGGVSTVVANTRTNVTMTGIVDDDLRNEWLCACDCALNPMFTGSGTNIKMFDFMAAGLPILSTPTGARGISSVSGGGLRLADKERFASALKDWLAKADGWPALGMQNRRWVEEEFAWERLSPLVGGQIAELIARRRAPAAISLGPKRIAHLSTVGQKCGIGEYTARLIDALESQGVENFLVTCATPANRPVRSALPGHAEIGWQYDDENWRDSTIDPEVLDRISAWGADWVLVQYHSAFMSAARLLEFTQTSIRRGMRVAIEVHNFDLSDPSALGTLSSLGCLLIAHNRREVAAAHAQNIALAYLPLLVCTAESATRRTLRDRNLAILPPCVATTGFIRPHKGLQPLIRALPLIRQRFPGTHLLLQCSLYPSPDSAVEYEECQQLAAQLGLEGAISFDPEFRPIDEVHRRLARADLGILPYAASNEGGSASATTIISTGLPLLVSRSQVFGELTSVVDVLEDTDPSTIAAAVCDLLADVARYDDLAARVSSYAESHSAGVVSRGLINLMQSDQARGAQNDPQRDGGS